MDKKYHLNDVIEKIKQLTLGTSAQMLIDIYRNRLFQITKGKITPSIEELNKMGDLLFSKEEKDRFKIL